MAAKGKVKKEKTGPKKPLTAYMFFNTMNRTKVIEENPGITFGETGKKLGAMWKELTDDGKKPYNKKAEDDKKRYQLELGQGVGKAAAADDDEE